jgi:exodeoxyribonuclease X
VDSETTGVGPQDKAVEVAGFYCEDNVIVDHYQSLVNPGIPIPPEASAVHHLTDDDVKDAPDIDDAMVPFFDKEFDFVVAHQASFDKRMMDFGKAPWACSLKMARAVYPEAVMHKNMYLYYWLKLPKLEHSIGLNAHRALFDSEATTHLFQHLLTKATTENPIEGILKLSNNPTLLKICKLKKHEGKHWSEVPRDYLNWILNPRVPHPQPFDEDIVFTAKYYYER